MQGGFVVDRDLFARRDIPQGEEKYVAVESSHVGIGSAGVIDVMRTVPTAAPVDAEASVDVTDTQLGSVRAPLRFVIRNYFAGVFGNFSAALERLSRKATLAVNWRPANRKTGRKFELHKSALYAVQNRSR